MRVDNVSFQASVPKNLNDKLFDVALKTPDWQKYLKQVKNVESWGLETSSLAEHKQKGQDGVLILVNNYFAPFKKVLLPQKGNLFETFMALTERDIQKAEFNLKI